MLSRNKLRLNRKRRIRTQGTSKIPRLSVFRSGGAIFAQIIDDVSQKTVFSLSSRAVDKKSYNLQTAEKTGEKLAQEAVKQGIKAVVFDRGGYKYHGKVKALAEGARKGGLKF